MNEVFNNTLQSHGTQSMRFEVLQYKLMIKLKKGNDE